MYADPLVESSLDRPGGHVDLRQTYIDAARHVSPGSSFFLPLPRFDTRHSLIILSVCRSIQVLESTAPFPSTN